MALTLDLLNAQEGLSGLTDEQKTALVGLSERDEETTFNRRSCKDIFFVRLLHPSIISILSISIVVRLVHPLDAVSRIVVVVSDQ